MGAKQILQMQVAARVEAVLWVVEVAPLLWRGGREERMAAAAAVLAVAAAQRLAGQARLAS